MPTELSVIEPREVPLGGLRAMTVRRTIPTRGRTTIGAWCFCDHYGPDDVARTGGMVVTAHPHIGLQTVSWLFTGEIEHRDSAGHHAMVVPGELNLMTAGHGISHTEISTEATSTLHGVQLWVALPEGTRDGEQGFVHHVPGTTSGDGHTVRVLLGRFLGDESPVPTHTPIMGAELVLEPGATLTVDLEPSFEHGFLLDTGDVTIDGRSLEPSELGHLDPGPSGVTLATGGGARLMVLGGEPFEEPLVMWWNFVGRTHEEVEQARLDWQAQCDGVDDGSRVRPGRFGVVDGVTRPPIPAPPLPGVRLKPRARA